MPATLSDRAQSILEDLPPYERDEPNIQAVVGVLANEVERLLNAAAEISKGLAPATTTDTYKLLSYWEQLFGLPVAPPGQSEAQRRAILLSRIQSRKSGSGADWVGTLTTALGPDTIWSHEEGPGDYEVTLHLPYDPAGYTIGTVLAIARAITPAHLDLLGAYNEGFLVGISQIGIETL